MPVRVLQVVGETERGGTETWLLHTLKHIDQSQVEMDFLVHTDIEGAYSLPICIAGASVLVCRHPRNPLRYALNFRRVLRKHGPYDIIHSHVDKFSGLVLFYARLFGIKTRVAHSHNDTQAIDKVAPLRRRAYTFVMHTLIKTCATAGLATSRAAAAALFGAAWQSDRRWRIHLSCVDLSRFRAPANKSAVRSELKISEDAIVFGHVGRFVEQKNHAFLVDLASLIAKVEDRAVFVLVGAGPCKELIEKAIVRLNLQDRFRVLSPRDDVASLMLGAFDCLLFPSLYEGLGLVLIEAQAAGIPCFVSTNIPPEAIVVPSLVSQLPLSLGPHRWTEEILKAVRNARREPRITRLETVISKGFDIKQNARQLTEFYLGIAG